MIPPSFDRESTPPGEQQLFDFLSKDPATDAWIVLHSFDLPRHEKNLQGEIDFVVVIPQLGIICLEVKSHASVARDENGTWRLGSDAPESRGPFKQASEAAFSLVGEIRRRAPQLSRIPVIAAVAFPRCTFAVPATEWDEWQVIDQQALRRKPISYLISAVLHNARAKFERQGKPREVGAPSDDEVDALVKTLRPKFEVHQSPKARARELEIELKRYTEEQFAVLDICDLNDRVFIQGGAGTGKTLLAIEQARRFANQGHRVLLTCFNRHLGTWLKSECESGGDAITVFTIHSLMRQAANLNPPTDPPQTFWDQQLPDAALTRLLNQDQPEEFDAIVIDEAQDILYPPFLDVLQLLVSKGIDGRWVMFGDLQKQAIYRHGANDPAAVLNQWFPGIAGFPLYLNCRNTPRIGAMIGQITSSRGLYHGYRRGDDGVEPQLKFWTSTPDQVVKLTAVLDDLRSEGYRNEDIAVLSMVPEDSSASRMLDNPWSSRIRPLEVANRGQGRSASIAAFKGLESRAVILTDISSLQDEWEMSMLYVGMSRAIDRLVVLVSDEARQQIATILVGR